MGCCWGVILFLGGFIVRLMGGVVFWQRSCLGGRYGVLAAAVSGGGGMVFRRQSCLGNFWGVFGTVLLGTAVQIWKIFGFPNHGLRPIKI